MDPETVRMLDALARRWGVSKSEALRRSIRHAAVDPGASSDAMSRLKALDRLQDSLAIGARRAGRWAAEARAERQANRRGASRR
jgi:hypothetical protein